MKDNFSLQSAQYFKFRPTYPQQLYDFLLPLLQTKQTAWDCGTGNGQVAQELSKYFAQVYATDISEKQIQNAVQRDNIIYKLEPAEKTAFTDNIFDLVTVAQAIHWFDFDLFYKEVRRTTKPGGILAIIGYGLITIDDSIDKVIDRFYHKIVGPYWDKERKYVDENYQTIPFPFEEIKTPSLQIEFDWRFDEFIGYLGTWSAVQHFIQANNIDPVSLIVKDIQQSWPIDKTKKISFPVLLRIGRV